MARLLLVDDEPAGIELRKLIFERLGHTVAIALNPTQAREKFAVTQPQTIVLDLRLPEAEDGLALIRDFRAASGEVRIIVLSGWPLDLEGKPEAAMVNEALGKPVRTEKLISAVGPV